MQTSSGGKLYGACLIPVDSEDGSGDEDVRPKIAVCLLSALPLVQFLRDGLRSLTGHSRSSWLSEAHEKLFSKWVTTNPAHLSVEVNRPLPVWDVDLSLLYRVMHPCRVLQVVEALLAEKQVLLLCDNLSTLTLAGETFLSLLSPLRWNYLYIPVLSLPLFRYLQCPTPYLMGIHSSYKEQAFALAEADVVCVDLNNDTVDTRTGALPRILPRSFSSGVLTAMMEVHKQGRISSENELYDHQHHTPELSPDRNWRVRVELMKLWGFILAGWRDFCVFLPDSQHPCIVFDSFGFVRSKADGEGDRDQELYDLLSVLVRSSYLPDFVHQRTDRHKKLGVSRCRGDLYNSVETVILSTMHPLWTTEKRLVEEALETVQSARVVLAGKKTELLSFEDVR